MSKDLTSSPIYQGPTTSKSPQMGYNSGIVAAYIDGEPVAIMKLSNRNWVGEMVMWLCHRPLATCLLVNITFKQPLSPCLFFPILSF